MTEIKSALELALERTQDIQGDKETLKINNLKNDGKKLASAFLDPGEDTDDKEASAKFKSLSGEQQKVFREGFFSVMTANLTLPTAAGYESRLEILEKGLSLVIKDKKQISYIFQQVTQFFGQYLQSREQLVAAVKQQYEPRLREKEQMLAQQMGSEMKLTPEQDPEFASLLQKNYAQLEEQYNQALQQVKEQLAEMFKTS